jgi:transposase InsO family protein
VAGWGWYYSIEVLDDYSRFVLASDLKPDMTADSISDVVEQAVAFTGMRQVPIERTIEQRLRYNLGRWNLKLKGELDAQV